MSMTEKEAKQRKCPFTFNIPGSAVQGMGEYNCCGSMCMAWEWDEKFGEDNDNWTGHCHLIFRPCGGAE